jgi:hypothetical protein
VEQRRNPTEALHRRRDLYALLPEEFTAARNALAKELKAAGDKEGAAEVAQLRRPSVGAHALNQVAHEQPDLIEAALDAGIALREASEAAARGDASGLREATASERAVAQAVAKAVKPHLGSRGDALVPALLATLRAGALDEGVAEQLRSGTLSTEHEQAGFGFGLEAGDGAVAPRRSAQPKAKKAPGRPKLKAVPDLPEPDPKDVAREKAERAEARAAERQRKKDLAAAEKNAVRLEREATRLANEADDAEADARAARQAAETGAERAADARRAVTALEAARADR